MYRTAVVAFKTVRPVGAIRYCGAPKNVAPFVLPGKAGAPYVLPSKIPYDLYHPANPTRTFASTTSAKLPTVNETKDRVDEERVKWNHQRAKAALKAYEETLLDDTTKDIVIGIMNNKKRWGDGKFVVDNEYYYRTVCTLIPKSDGISEKKLTSIVLWLENEGYFTHIDGGYISVGTEKLGKRVVGMNEFMGDRFI